MKTVRILVCAVLLLASGLGFAQVSQERAEQKRIAVMEVVDKSGTVNDAVKAIVRNQMVAAITRNQDYEVYSRSDIGSIIQEHEFQRTGLVSEDQIRQLGKMSGVSLVLVTEVMPFSESQISISAKVLDVETAKVVGTAMSVSPLTPEDIENRCREIAVKLFGARDQVGKTIRL